MRKWMVLNYEAYTHERLQLTRIRSLNQHMETCVPEAGISGMDK